MGGLALLHTVSLEGIAEGWTADCKLVYRGIKYAELKALQSVDKATLTDEAALDQIIQFVKDHFVSAKGLKFNKDGTTSLGDLTHDDVADLPVATLSSIFNHMNGGTLDPKDTPQVAPSAPQPLNSEVPTATT